MEKPTHGQLTRWLLIAGLLFCAWQLSIAALFVSKTVWDGSRDWLIAVLALLALLAVAFAFSFRKVGRPGRMHWSVTVAFVAFTLGVYPFT